MIGEDTASGYVTAPEEERWEVLSRTGTSPRMEPTWLGLQDLKEAAGLQQLRQWEAVEGAQRPLWARF